MIWRTLLRPSLTRRLTVIVSAVVFVVAAIGAWLIDLYLLADLPQYTRAEALPVIRPLLVGLVIGITLITALVTALMIRRTILPLGRLTASAKMLSQGDLATPIRTDSQIPEVRVLANVLEKTRIALDASIRELSSANQWSASLIASVVEGIITLDSAGMITFYSEGAARLTGVPAENAVGRPVEAVLPAYHEPNMPLMEYIPPEGSRRNITIRAADGRAATLTVTRARQLEDGQVTIVLHDVTEEMQLHNLQAYFLANVSHEFRTPLSGMRVSLELLLENLHELSRAEINELLNSQYLSVSTLQSLIDNLLESSKIEAGRFVLRRKAVDVLHLLSEAIRLTQPFLHRKQQTLTLDVPLTLPGIYADENRLVQVMVNLLSNATKYSPMGASIEICATLSEANVLRVSVMDRGVGIPEARRKDVFRQFVRLEGGTSAEQGSGLGLAVVKAIVNAHGGGVGVDARAGGGSVFWFTLPITAMSEESKA